jgi:CheY-like chemotaxis protein/nitrogen-specific signal transduction histidine kinase
MDTVACPASGQGSGHPPGNLLEERSQKDLLERGQSGEQHVVKVRGASMLHLQRLESLGALAAGIAHDLNNVLTPVALAVGLLRSGVVGETQRQRLLDTIQMSVNRASELLQHVVHFAQDQEAHSQVLEPASLLEGVGHLLHRTLPRSIELNLRVELGVGRVLGDGTQLSQALVSLAVLARDAMPQGGILTLAARTALLDPDQASPWPPGNPASQVLLSITAERGEPGGVPPLFTPLSSCIDASRELAFVRSIIHRHQGFLEVENPPECLTFRIGLPVTSGPAPATAEPLPAVGPAAACGVLLVDDEPAIQATLRSALELHGYRVLTASNGAEALALHRQHGPGIDVVIIDLLMPVLDGWRAIQALLELNDQVRIIATSGMTGHATRLPGSPRLTFLPKPFTTRTLLQVLTEVQARSPH